MALVADILTLAFLILAVVYSLIIVHEVSKRGVKVDLFRLKSHLIRYIGLYKRLTREETGKVGPLYYPCIGFYVAALVFAIIHLIAR